LEDELPVARNRLGTKTPEATSCELRPLPFVDRRGHVREANNDQLPRPLSDPETFTASNFSSHNITILEEKSPMVMEKRRILVIAGSDSSGGA